ncbi:MAG: ABC transporter permease [Candidatus Aminicenantes bacterium]|nr:ABC transporter permease [Candidatus Aminicenantes bacterium]
MLKRLLNLKKYLKPSDISLFLKTLYRNRKIILQMAKDDFRNQFLGSFLGVFWAFVQPLVFVFALWFVFSLGLRQARGNAPVPYVLWLMAGMFLWFFFSQSILRGTGAILESSYLVKNVKFQVSILPVMKILSALIVHAIFIVLMLVLYLANGIWPNLYWFQIIYYLAATVFLEIGLAWIFSSLTVFVKDVSQIVQIMVRIGFWLTPVFWSIDRMPSSVQFILKLNPMYYLVQGYRDSLIYKTGFWEHPYLTLYFWVVTFLILVFGGIVFRRLRPHFADVL